MFESHLGLSSGEGVVDALLDPFGREFEAVEVRQLLAGEVAAPLAALAPDLHPPVAAEGLVGLLLLDS